MSEEAVKTIERQNEIMEERLKQADNFREKTHRFLDMLAEQKRLNLQHLETMRRYKENPDND